MNHAVVLQMLHGILPQGDLPKAQVPQEMAVSVLHCNLPIETLRLCCLAGKNYNLAGSHTHSDLVLVPFLGVRQVFD